LKGEVVGEQLNQPTLARLTADITAAYVAHHLVSPSDVPSLIAWSPRR
jgi:predicted transcriptional regulator